MEDFYKKYIRDVENFPKEGVTFKDITPLLSNSLAFNAVIDNISVELERFGEVNLIAGIEARGFIFGAAAASLNTLGFVPIRKAGKLPPPVVSIGAKKEYGEDVLEVKRNENVENRIVIIDDVMATAGTLIAAERLLTEAGYEVVGAIVLVDLPHLHDNADVLIGGKKVVSLTEY